MIVLICGYGERGYVGLSSSAVDKLSKGNALYFGNSQQSLRFLVVD